MKRDANERIYEVTFFLSFVSSFPRLKLSYLPYLIERIYTRPIFYDSCRIAEYLVFSPVSYSDHMDRASWLWLTEVQSGWLFYPFLGAYLLTYQLTSPIYLPHISTSLSKILRLYHIFLLFFRCLLLFFFFFFFFTPHPPNSH